VRSIELAAPAVRRGEVGLTERGTPTIKIYISAEGVEKAYRLYLRDIELRFGSSNEEEALLGASLLRLAGGEGGGQEKRRRQMARLSHHPRHD